MHLLPGGCVPASHNRVPAQRVQGELPCRLSVEPSFELSCSVVREGGACVSPGLLPEFSSMRWAYIKATI